MQHDVKLQLVLKAEIWVTSISSCSVLLLDSAGNSHLFTVLNLEKKISQNKSRRMMSEEEVSHVSQPSLIYGKKRDCNVFSGFVLPRCENVSWTQASTWRPKTHVCTGENDTDWNNRKDIQIINIHRYKKKKKTLVQSCRNTKISIQNYKMCNNTVLETKAKVRSSSFVLSNSTVFSVRPPVPRIICTLLIWPVPPSLYNKVSDSWVMTKTYRLVETRQWENSRLMCAANGSMCLKQH